VIFALPLALSRNARASYASAARIVLATFAVLVLLGAFGTAIVAPLVWSEQLVLAAFLAAFAGPIYALWCLFIVRRKRPPS
jgi:hypothetical protein